MLTRHILEKRGIRSDILWDHATWSEILLRAPLALDTTALRESERWSRGQLTDLAEARTQAILDAARVVPFWSERIRQSPGETPSQALSRLPSFSRKDLSRHGQEYYTDSRRLLTSVTDFTSGSTGRPFQFFFDRGAILRSYALNERHFLAVGNGTRYPIVSLRARPKIGFALRNHHHFYVRGGFGIQSRLPAFISFVETLTDGCIIYSFPSLLIEVARAAHEQRLRLPIRGIITSGETLRQHEREFIETTLDARISNCYGTRELGALGFECAQGRIHLNEEWARFEILDSHDAPVADAEGRIIVTTYDNRVMPFIRYDTGDRGRISDAPCPCGRTLRTIDLHGRQSDHITLKSGRIVSLLDVTPVFDAYFDAVQAYQLVERSPSAFVIRVVAGPRFDERNDELRLNLIHALHSEASIVWEHVASIEPSSTGKAVYFVREQGSL